MLKQTKSRVNLFALFSPVLIAAVSWFLLLKAMGVYREPVFLASVQNSPPVSENSMMIPNWTLEYFMSLFFMWSIMMIAMMVPGILFKLQNYRRYDDLSTPHNVLSIPSFILGYGLFWIFFSALATIVQLILETFQLLDPKTMQLTNSFLSSFLLTAVGIYQISPLKAKVRFQCRRESRPTVPLIDGVIHGVHCTLNSAPLMLLLFVGGVMNLYWIIGLSLTNLLERLLPSPKILSLLVGFVSLTGGIYHAV